MPFVLFLCASFVMHILFLLFIAAALIQCCYAVWYVWGSFQLSKQLSAATVASRQPVSVIICAHNEGAGLEQQLALVLEQDYTDEDRRILYEVIVVNDRSDDNTAVILLRLQQQYKHLRIVTIAGGEQRLFPGKKFALSRGLAATTTDLLLLTDADCYPASRNWLELMTRPLLQGKELAAGYGAYVPADDWLNGFIRWETLHTFMQYSTYAWSGIPYMAVGRNLACKKELLVRAQQTKEWSLLPSGDDDLLIRSGATATNMAIVSNPAARTFSHAKNNVQDWLHQKQRHVSTGKLYKTRPRLLLGLYGLTHGLTWLLGIILLCRGFILPVAGLWLLRVLLLVIAGGRYAAALEERGMKIKLVAGDIGWAIYNFALSPYIFLKNKQQWT